MDSYPRIPLQRSNPENLDRFIPNRAALDYDYAHFMLTGGERKSKENPSPYQKMLEESFQMNRPRILSFKDNLPTPIEPIPRRLPLPPLHKPKSLRHIPQGPERILDAPGIVDDLSLNLLDWSSKNILAVAIGNTVYLWNASNSSIAELVTIDEEDGPVTSVSWACDGWQIAVGLNNSFIQLWDSISLKRVGMFRGGRQGRVGSLAWNKNILTTGGMDGRITNNDPRIDNLRKWLHRLEDHIAAIKALAWCPFQENLLASGGGEGDQCIEFWNTRTGLMLELVENGSEGEGDVAQNGRALSLNVAKNTLKERSAGENALYNSSTDRKINNLRAQGMSCNAKNRQTGFLAVYSSDGTYQLTAASRLRL
ncbi:unnamed protein product [Malus baccata var. baccata]